MTSFAVPIPEDIIKQSKALTRFPVLVHANHSLCLDRSSRLKEEFKATLNVQLDAKTIDTFPLLGPVHTVAFIIPGCLPERLPVLAEFVDFAALKDEYKHWKSIPLSATATFVPNMWCFGLGIHLTREEKAKYSEVVNLALTSAALVDDYYSWPKEIKHHIEKKHSKEPLNAVSILMRQYNCSEPEALAKLREEYVFLQEKHLALLQKIERDEGLTETHRKYITATQHAASGSEFWSIFARRYPTKAGLNQPECVLVGGEFQYETADSVPCQSSSPLTDKSATFAINSGIDNVNAKNTNTSDANDVHENRTNSTLKDQGAPHTLNEIIKPSDDIVLAPYKYIASLPSKNTLAALIDALNLWLKIPQPILSTIKKIADMLHHALDDIEDNSKLRRGKPSTHLIYGAAQTINSANYVFVNTFAELSNLSNAAASAIYIDEVQNSFCGQASDLHWKYHSCCPTVEEYMMMIDNKTGALFRLCVRLMQAESAAPNKFVTLLGRYYQIRDDYQNLASKEYTKFKGFCEDLDEGKMSLPLIYTLQHPGAHQKAIQGVLQHKGADGLPLEVKSWVLAYIQETGSLKSTLTLIHKMQHDLLDQLSILEQGFGSRNFILQLLLLKLQF
ncbi:geranylgeranyl pyrophosphate synthase [Microsporum canis CBS 113480]|uniref:Geranylgeranyl pyrophosphate synthase n=1 Tax=Arthroderma otae (strain ATCC MYA-4605 / CBS 113480) TaxID=554155 RepID=C5FGL9_ARTOC|nr:geranylgeranyl pyrophosphate synthase [Microsporum canis CBS 113480]EEQ29904.1 geranylgeranyl pyrophosphate synthase [Microsporum canis CBS 113480]